MADSEQKMYGGRWQEVRFLGKGGQGNVYEVADMKGIPSRQELAILLKEGLNKVLGSEVYAMNPSIPAFDGLVDAIRKTVAGPSAPRGALKVLLPIDDAINATTALDRMATEVNDWPFETSSGRRQPRRRGARYVRSKPRRAAAAHPAG